ncbi:ArsC/Spx/MgsR family protein [Nocardioides dokdonensis]|uniref:ArsC/Spx/MgsR family protein n=1 Tax=Nocardioides dokdonensis TaxID=450734 RepID=UPI0008344711|nr:ArsC/Spx/MgsR family protein [Nocardioides dokdonensis]
MEIWINPACSKCRTATAALDEAGVVADLPRTTEARGQWLDALAAHPRLIQRPIITADDGTTVVGRDPESLARVLPG